MLRPRTPLAGSTSRVYPRSGFPAGALANTTTRGPVADSTRFLAGYPADAKLPPVTPGALGPDKWGALASGDLTAWAGPWGVSFSANLTPDETGLGSWNEEAFIKTMRTGKHL